MARLDRLPDAKEVAQVAACIGREFDHAALAAVADRAEADLRHSLDQLCAAELLIRRDSTPDTGYSFKHALVREVAYESLLKSRRRGIHARLLAALERCDGPAPEQAAYHAAAAELWAKALHYYGVAGTAALDRAATAEGLGLIAKALEAGRRLGGDITAEVAMIGLLRARSWAYLAMGDTPRVMVDLRDAETRAARFGMKRLSCQLRAQRAHVESVFGGHTRRAIRYGHEAARIANVVGDRELSAAARCVLGLSYMFAGDCRAAVVELGVEADTFRHGLRIGAIGGSGTLAVEGLAVLGDCLGQLGSWDEALARGAEAQVVAGETGLPWDMHVANYHLARTHLARGDAVSAVPLVESALSFGRRSGLAMVVTLHEALLGGALLLSGRPGEAIELLDRAAAQCAEMRLQWVRTHTLLLRAGACLAVGRDEAPVPATEALELARAHGYRAFEVSALRLLATCTLPADPAGAQERLRMAKELAAPLALVPELAAIAAIEAGTEGAGA
jgi:tetratricopeptide (TPR) repeat protein